MTCVRYIFLQNHLTEFDETLHALSTLPDRVDLKLVQKLLKLKINLILVSEMKLTIIRLEKT